MIPQHHVQAGTSFDVADSNDYFEDAINRLSWEQFLSTLPEKDQVIIRLKKEGYTDQEIADKVGYKTHKDKESKKDISSSLDELLLFDE